MIRRASSENGYTDVYIDFFRHNGMLDTALVFYLKRFCIVMLQLLGISFIFLQAVLALCMYLLCFKVLIIFNQFMSVVH